MTRLVAGLDLGSTNVKVLVADADRDCAAVVVEQRPTPWTAVGDGRTELDPAALVAVLADLLAVAAARAIAAVGDDARVLAVSVSGMGESGVLIDGDGRAVTNAVAWFDPRGEEQLAALPDGLRRDFPAVTGLPLGVQVTAMKLAAFVAGGVDLTDLRWQNLPDHIAAAMGGEVLLDASLTSRTGLIDQGTGRPWAEVLRHLGATADLLPEIVDSGHDRGPATAGWLPGAFAGARLSVAGHDHLVSAVAAGAVSSDSYHASLGTAEVLLRVLDAPLSADARVRLAEHFINHVRHVLPGRHVLVAGVKTGLLMGRALQLVGVRDRSGRDRLDDAVMALPPAGGLAPGAVLITGARNDDGVLGIRVQGDGVTPEELFLAVLNHGNDELAVLVAAMDREVPPATSTRLTGGWAGMRSVQRARSTVLPGVLPPVREQDTAHGAALIAASTLTDADRHPSVRP